jgi:pectate lyase
VGGNFNAGGSSPGTAGSLSSGPGGQSLAGAAGRSGSADPLDAGRQFPSGTLLLEEDFEELESSEWRATADSAWELTEDDELDSTVYGQTETSSSGAHLVISGDVSWTDVVVEADFKVLEFNGSSSGYMAGLCVRVRDAENFYMVGLRSGTGQIQLRAFSDGGSNLAQSSFEDGATGEWYHLRVEAVGSTISAYLDDALMLTHTDTTHASGAIGLCTVRASAVFDNVRVTAP